MTRISKMAWYRDGGLSNVNHTRRQSASGSWLYFTFEERTMTAMRESRNSAFVVEGDIQILRDMFPDGKCSWMNFVMFGTSGVHGTYDTLNDIEKLLQGASQHGDLTVVLVQPRMALFSYGRLFVKLDDIPFLRQLEESSAKALAAFYQGDHQNNG